MKYTFNRREFEDNRIKTYYDTNLEVGHEKLSAIHTILYDGIKDKLGIKVNAKATMAVLTNGGFYSIMFLEIISHPYIEYLPKSVVRRNKTKASESNEPSFDSYVKAENTGQIADFGLDLSQFDPV